MNRRTLDAFELIYPMGESHCKRYDRNRDLLGYKSPFKSLRVQEIYYSLPEESTNSYYNSPPEEK